MIGGAAFLAGGFILLNALAYRHARSMMRFDSSPVRTAEPERLAALQKLKVLLFGVNIPRPRTALPPSELASHARPLRIQSSLRVELGAWYATAPGSECLVILFHGYSGEKTGALAEARAFLELGCSVLLVDFRGSGDSSESYTTIGYDEAEDVAAAVAFARANLPENRRVLYGQSMGAAAVLCAVKRFGVEADAIVAEAVFDRLLNTVRHRFELMGVPAFPNAELLLFWGGRQAGFNAFTHNPAEYAAAVRCPALFLQGAADPRARPAEARRVYDAVQGRKWFQAIPGLRHEPAIVAAPEEWKRAVKAFLDELPR